MLVQQGASSGIYTHSLQNPPGWSGGAMVLGKLPVPGRPTIWVTVGQVPTALVVDVWEGELFGHFYSHLPFSLLFLPLFGRRPDID